MAISGIPMPKLSGEILDEGTQKILESLLQGKRQQQQLNLQAQANARQQALLPHMLQEYKDKEEKNAAMREYAKRFYGIQDNNAPQNPENPQLSQAPQNPQQSMQGNNQAAGVPPVENEKPPVHEAVHENLKDNLQSGQEMVVKRGDPKMYFKDAHAGETDPYIGVRIPDIKTHTADGVQYDRYPSGKVVATKVGPSDSEKKAAQEEETEKKIHFQTVEKQNVEDEKSARPLVKSHRYLLEMKKLLQENPGLTGPGSALSLKMGVSENSPLGKFKSLQGKLQAEIGRYASQRGGVQAVNWAGSIKPDVFNQPELNMGMIEQGIQDIQDEYGDIGEDYSKRNKGKELPLKLGTGGSSGKVTMYKDGVEYHIPKKLAEQAQKEGGFTLGR